MAGHVGLVALYLCLNSSLNMINRYVLGIYGFAFPMLLTICHMLFGFVALFVPVLLARRPEVHKQTWKRQWRGFLCVGAFMAMNIGLNNVSLVSLPLSLNQVLRAGLPVVTAVVAMFVESKVPTRHEVLALLLLTGGVCITIFEGNAMGNLSGLGLAIAGVLCAAGMMSMAGKVLSEKLDVMQLTFYTAPISCSVLFPFFLAREWDRFKLYAADNGPATVSIILISSIVALAYNLVHNYLLQRTSSVTVTVLGEVKIVGLLILSAMFLPGERSQFNSRMTVGVVTAIAGFCMYSNAKLFSSHRSDSQLVPAASNVLKLDVELPQRKAEDKSPAPVRTSVFDMLHGSHRRVASSPAKNGQLMQALQRLAAADRNGVTRARETSCESGRALRSRPSSPARQDRQLEDAWDRCAIEATSPFKHQPHTPRTLLSCSSPTMLAYSEQGHGAMQRLSMNAKDREREAPASHRDTKADHSPRASVSSLLGPDTPPGSDLEAGFTRSSSTGELCSTPELELSSGSMAAPAARLVYSGKTHSTGDVPEAQPAWGMVEQFRPGAPYVQAGQHCQPMDSNKVVMGTPLQMGVLTWTRTR